MQAPENERMDPVTKGLWIAVGALSVLLTLLIACLGTGFAVGAFLRADDPAPFARAPSPIAPAATAPAALHPTALDPIALDPIALDPITLTARGVGFDVLDAARGIEPARPWFRHRDGRLNRPGAEAAMATLGPSPEFLFVALQVQGWRRMGLSRAEVVEGVLMVFADGRVRYTEVKRRDVTDAFVLAGLATIAEFPQTTSDERMLRASADRFLRAVSTCTLRAPDATDLLTLPDSLSAQFVERHDPVATAEACRTVAAAGTGAYDMRNVTNVTVMARGQGHLARVSTRFLPAPSEAAALQPVGVIAAPL